MRSLLAGRSASQLPIWARLVLDLDQLARVEWVSLEFYAIVRGIETQTAARRNLFRVKQVLREHGVELVVAEEQRRLAARFGVPAVAELVEPDVRPARAILERLEARHENREPELDGLVGESAVLSPETISLEYRGRAKSFAWIARKHGVGKERIRRILVSTGPIRAPGLRRRLEERRPTATIEAALAAADRGDRLEEIARILACGVRTARRFLRRHGRTLPVGRPRS